MPPSKTFTIQCSPQQAALLSEALRVYAHAAFPPGGSECAQVSRQALLGSAETLEQSQGEAQLRKRQRRVIQSAVSWYFSEDGPGNSAAGDELLALLQGKTQER